MYVNPGELNKKVQIISVQSDGVNANGIQQKTEREVRACFARVSNTSGTEIIKANSEFFQAKKRFLVRYTDTEINTDMIVRYKGRDYDIEYVNSYGDNKEYLEIWTSLEGRV